LNKRHKYRNKAQIISQILEIANGGGATKTKLIYYAFLNYDKLKGYLVTLNDSQLISYDEKTRTFKTTEKGLTLLQVYNRMDQIFRTINLGT
jgi:predicted transcriptional regulator